MDYTLTNLFSSELADRGYRFLTRNTDDSLYAFKNEPTKVKDAANASVFRRNR